MPEFDKLSSYANEAALEQETAFILSEFKKVVAGGQEMVDLLLAAQKKLTFGNIPTKQLADGIEQLNQKTAVYGKQVAYVAGESKKLADNTVILKKATEEETASLEKNIETRRRLQNSMQSYIKSQKDDAELLKAGTITRDEYNKRIVEGQVKIEQYKNRITELDKTIKSQTGTEKQRYDEQLKSLTKIEKLQKAVYESERNSLGRAQALILLYTAEKKKLNLATEDGARLNENYNKAIQKANAFILANADAETVRTKTVGKYGEAIMSAGSKLLSSLRLVANIIPGLGLGGLIGLLVEPIIMATKSLLGFGEVSEQVRLKQEAISRAYKNAADSAGDEIAKLTVLKAVLDSEVATRNQKKTALEELKKINVDYFGQLDLENGKVKGLDLAYDGYIQKLLRSITAKASIEQITEVIKEQAEAIGELNKKGFGAGSKTADNLTDWDILYARQKFNLTFGADKGQSVLIDQNQRALIAKLLNSESTIRELTSRIKESIADAFEPDKKVTKEKTPEVVKESTKETFNAAFEEMKRQIQRQIGLLDEQVNNEKISYAERKQALQDFADWSNALINLEADKEKKSLQEKLTVLNTNVKKVKGTERNNILAEIKDTNQRIKDVENKAAFERLKVQDAFGKRLQDLIDKQHQEKLKRQREAIQKINDYAQAEREAAKSALDVQYSQDVQALNERLAAGEISQKEYNEKRARLDFAYHEASLKAEIAYAKKLLAIQAITGKDVSKQLAALAMLEMQLSDLVTKKVIDNESKKKKAIIEAFDKLKEISSQVFSLIDSIIDANTITQKNALREQQDEAEKKAEREIEIVNAQAEQGIITQEEASRKIQVIEARKQAQKEQFERRNRDIELQKAKFEKAKTIFSISLELARALASLDFLKAAFAAAQLAIAIATPLPRYAKGKKKGEGKSSLSMVNEIRDEVIRRKDGSVEMPKGRNVYTWIDKDDEVFSSKAAFLQQMQGSAMVDVAIKSSKGISENTYASLMIKGLERTAQLEAENNQLLQQIADKPVQIMNGNGEMVEGMLAWASRKVKYNDWLTNW